MTNIRLVIAYMGAAFQGWQKTKTGPSVEETLERVLSKILQQDMSLQAASRTDAGVHAKAQVVNFFSQASLSLHRLRHSLNGMLPKDIAVLAIEEMPDSFHPTLDCVKKEYEYHLCYSPIQLPFHRQTSWHFPYPLDKEAMHLASQHLCGTHDFSAFCNERKRWDRDPVCHLEAIDILPLPGERLLIRMTADHFLFRMARNIAGTLARVGCGKLQEGEIPSILASRDRTQSGMTAPAHGLTLNRVFYS